MKNFYLLPFVVLFLFSACKKEVESVPEEIAEMCNPELATALPLFISDACNEVELEEEMRSCALSEMLMFIYASLEYPSMAMDEMIEGDVSVRYEVALDGTTRNHRIIDSVGFGCDEEAIRVAELLRFVPAKNQCGDDIEVTYTLIFRFRL